MIRRIINRISLGVAREIRSRRYDITSEPVTFHSSAGYRIAATLTRPATEGLWPSVVIAPGADHDRRFFETRASPIHPSELAALGLVVLTYDPSGRGESWGPEDYGGPEHQDNAAQAIRFLHGQTNVDVSHTGLVGISLGISSAIGAARLLAEADQPVDWVLDWEGPCDQGSITANQTMNAPAMGHKSSDRTYWEPREALTHVPHIQCGYHRLQAHPDHAQPEELNHAIKMITAASKANLPWFRLNNEPESQVSASPRWLAPGPLAANRAILQAIRDLLKR